MTNVPIYSKIACLIQRLGLKGLFCNLATKIQSQWYTRKNWKHEGTCITFKMTIIVVYLSAKKGTTHSLTCHPRHRNKHDVQKLPSTEPTQESY